YVRRITSSWDEATVTWNTQPTTTTQNQIMLPPSTSNTQDYTNIDVTTLVQDMINNPAQSFGFLLQLVTEAYYRSVMFASSDHSNPALHPLLQICFDYPTGVVENEYSSGSFNIYPNPVNDKLEIRNPKSEIRKIEIYNNIGERIFSQQLI